MYTRLHENEENRSPQVSPPDLAIKTTSIEQEMDTLPEAKGTQIYDPKHMLFV